MNRRDFIYAASVGAASATTMPTMTIAQGNTEIRKDAPQASAKLRTITLEEHFASPGWCAGPGRDFVERMRKTGGHALTILEQVQNVGDGRIAAMDAAGIDVQVLSLSSPGVEQSDAAEQVAIARESNDFIADVVKQYPKRFAAFAALPVAVPDKAADELERRVKQQGFKGTLINGHSRGRYLDDKFFWPILERAQALNVPIYLHPTVPAKPVAEVLYGGFSPAVSGMFESAGWGWHIETGVHLVRMVLGGVFDRYPKLQVVVGHLGEGVPFMLERLNRNMPMRMTKLERPLAAYLAKMSTTPLRASISRRHFSICCSKSGSTGSCSRATILTRRWRRRARFWTTCPSAPPTGRASRTAMRSGFLICRTATDRVDVSLRPVSVVRCALRRAGSSCWRTCGAGSALPPPALPVRSPRWHPLRCRGRAE